MGLLRYVGGVVLLAGAKNGRPAAAIVHFRLLLWLDWILEIPVFLSVRRSSVASELSLSKTSHNRVNRLDRTWTGRWVSSQTGEFLHCEYRNYNPESDTEQLGYYSGLVRCRNMEEVRIYMK